MRHPHHLPRGYRSIFRRLLVVFIVGAALVTFSIGGFFRWHFAGQGPFRGVLARNLHHYSVLLTREIGSPPRMESLRTLNADLGIGIRARAGGQEIAYPKDMPGFTEVTPWRHAWIPGFKMGKRGREFFALYEPDPQHQYLFLIYPEPGSLVSPWPWVALTLSLLLVLFFVHGRTRKLFRPLAELSDAVERVSHGQFNIQFKRQHKDELGLLMDRFQAMAVRIAGMIRDKEQLLLDVSHELRSPLARAKVALELLPAGNGRANLETDLREMEAMVSQLLESARLERGGSSVQREEVPVRVLVERALARVAKGSVEVRISGIAGATVWVDPERAVTAVRNLIENAVKYTELKGGSPTPVEVSWSEVPVEILIRDHGIGIPESELSRVSEPFYRVDRSRTKSTGGFGLGLSLARRIIEAHGGTLKLESHEKEGTLVRVSFGG